MIRSDAVNIRPHSIPAIGCRPNRDDIDWPIERVILGTGEPDADGWLLDRGQFYASDVVVGDLGTFHPIVFSMNIILQKPCDCPSDRMISKEFTNNATGLSSPRSA